MSFPGITEVTNGTWIRKHDAPGSGINAPLILYPQSLQDCIEICRTRGSSQFLKAAGSHWALSEAAISGIYGGDDVFIETNDPNNQYPAMDHTLYDVVPGCLSDGVIEILGNKQPDPFDQNHVGENEGTYLVHFESGKRIYQAYSELDLGDDNNQSLAVYLAQPPYNKDYSGSWAFQTLGGAGGQTVLGALITGTHGGDVYMPPLADSVLALHLVADGGKHYWIEPSTPPTMYGQQLTQPLTDDNKLHNQYDNIIVQGVAAEFEIIRDDELFNSVLISAGRFGIVYSIVMRVVRQYSLHENYKMLWWQDVKKHISNPDPSKPNNPLSLLDTIDGHHHDSAQPPRFLQLVVCLTQLAGQNQCAMTQRWNVPLAGPDDNHPNGRDERRGRVLTTNDHGPIFEFAGASHPYAPDPDNTNSAAGPSFLERACSSAYFVDGVVDTAWDEVDGFLNEDQIVIGGLLDQATTNPVALPAAVSMESLVGPLSLLSDLLRSLFGASAHAALSGAGSRLGETMNYLKNKIFQGTINEGEVLFWQMVANGIFQDQTKQPSDYEAISYAIMDRHDYLDKSCLVNVDSIEVFFDGGDSTLIAFIDALIAYESKLEQEGSPFVGYASLRFTGKTNALIGMEQYAPTCSVEVAGLKDVDGTSDLIDFAMNWSLNQGGILHWGQRNDSTIADIEDRFGSTIYGSGGGIQYGSEEGTRIGIWRKSLGRITENGRLNGFSSQFTRKTGLEIAHPSIENLEVDTSSPYPGATVTIKWDCNQNPPQESTTNRTEIKIDVSLNNKILTSFSALPLVGQQQFVASDVGDYEIELKAAIVLNGVDLSNWPWLIQKFRSQTITIQEHIP